MLLSSARLPGDGKILNANEQQRRKSAHTLKGEVRVCLPDAKRLLASINIRKN
jgi:hypothetical protein